LFLFFFLLSFFKLNAIIKFKTRNILKHDYSRVLSKLITAEGIELAYYTSKFDTVGEGDPKINFWSDGLGPALAKAVIRL